MHTVIHRKIASLCVVTLILLSVGWTLSVRADGPKISDAVRRPTVAPKLGLGKKESTRDGNKSAAAVAKEKESARDQGDQKLPEPGGVELKSSRVYAFVGKTGLGHEHAVIGMLKSGTVHLGKDDHAGTVEFDMRSFIADTPEARQYVSLKGETDRGTAQKVNSNMLGPDVLNVASFPTATFEIASIKKQRDLKDGVVEYLFEGDFTLHGVARRIRFTALAEPTKGWQRVRGKFTIRQSDFGITPFTTALGAIGVANELTIYGDLWVRPE